MTAEGDTMTPFPAPHLPSPPSTLPPRSSRPLRRSTAALQCALLEPFEPRVLLSGNAPAAPAAFAFATPARLGLPYTITYDNLRSASGATDAENDALVFLLSRVDPTAGFLYIKRTGVDQPFPAPTSLHIGPGDVLAFLPARAGVISPFTVRASDNTQYAANESAAYILTADTPIVSLAATVPNAWEGTINHPGQLTLTRTGDLSVPLTVRLMPIDNNPSNAAGGARHNVNYRITDASNTDVGAPGKAITVTIPAGQSSLTFNVNALQDNSIATASQQAALMILADTSATPAYLPNGAAWFAGANIIDSAPTIAIAPAAAAIPEAAANQVAFVITRTAAPGQPLDTLETFVNLSYTGSSFSLAHLAAPPVAYFAPGETTKQIVVSTTNDGLNGTGQTLVAAISGTGFAVPGSRTGTLTLTDASPTVSVVATLATAVEATGTPGQIQVTRTGSTDVPLDVAFTTGTAATNAVRNVGYYLAYTNGSRINGNIITVPAGAQFVLVDVVPIDDFNNTATTASITLVANGTLYNLPTGTANGSTATVTITNNPRPPTILNPTINRVGTRNSPIEMSFEDLVLLTGARLADGSRGALQLRVGTVTTTVGTLQVRTTGTAAPTAAGANTVIGPGMSLIWTPVANTPVNSLVGFTLFAVDGGVASVASSNVVFTVL
jgi:hypothetical protein